LIQSSISTSGERATAIERALQSRTFARSEQLKAFLRFVCEAEMRNPGSAPTEYIIGVNVLGRPEGYSPAEDSSVRTRAYDLRQKLEKLYATELVNEPVQIIIPKGSYTPQFVKRHVPTRTPPEPLEDGYIRVGGTFLTRPARHKGTRFVPWIFAGASLLAAILAWRMPRTAVQTQDPDVVLREAWGPLAQPAANVLLAAATPLVLVAGPATHAVFGSKDYPAPPEAYTLFRQHRPSLPKGQLGFTFSDNLLAVGTMNAILSSVETLRSFGTGYQVLPERVATISTIRGRNTILFGTPIDSEAVSLTLQDIPFTIDYEPSVREFVVRNRLTGKLMVPKKNAAGDFLDAYGLLTVIGSRYQDPRHLETVAVSGITSVGTQGAAEFFSSPNALRRLRTEFAKEGVAGFPSAYQVVVHCVYNNLLLLSYEYSGHAIISR
jgi:hypothetical protein